MAIEEEAGVTVTEATVGVVFEFVLVVEPPPLARKTQIAVSKSLLVNDFYGIFKIGQRFANPL